MSSDDEDDKKILKIDELKTNSCDAKEAKTSAQVGEEKSTNQAAVAHQQILDKTKKQDTLNSNCCNNGKWLICWPNNK